MWHLLSLVLASAPAALPQPAVQTAPPAITLPTVTVTAQKEPADPRRLPVSVSAVSRDVIERAGFDSLSDAAILSPNTVFAELSARKVSNAFIRGIGSSPANPGVTTYIDGVPQLNANSANVELLDVEQIEFVRGPQSALFGRNTLGGLVSVTSGRPSLAGWTARADVPYGTGRDRGARATVSGPVSGAVALGVSVGHRSRDGFTTNGVTGNLLDSRSATFGQAQVLWVPSPVWEARVILGGERARDGDYALNDLDALRRDPLLSHRDTEGHTRRDLWSTTLLLRREGRRLAFSSTTGLVSWRTRDATDLDYSARPLIARTNAEDDRQWTQEFRLASAADAPAPLSSGVSLRWQTGVFLFIQQYEQSAVNAFSPYVLSPFVPFAVAHHSPESALDDAGVGAYGQATLIFCNELDVTLGARVDHERKTADLRTFYSPAIASGARVEARRSFSDVSPQASLAWRPAAHRTVYASIGRGFKAGGFNPASPAGGESYGEERAWNVEGGLKAQWAGGRISATAAVFRIDWDDMQLNAPNPGVPGQFFIANVGGATSTGAEIELSARPRAGVSLFGAVGLTRARFAPGSRSNGVDVAGNALPNAPGHTASMGIQFAGTVAGETACYGRADVVFYGSYHYDDLNRAGQDAYSLTHLRAGVQRGHLFLEGWIRNAFDTRYVPVAFPYGGLAPSGFLGESGRPRTFGLSARIVF